MDQSTLNTLHALTDKQREYALSRQSALKDVGMAYICWFLFGVHYFYVGKVFVNLLYWITGGGFGIWAFFDLFRIPGIVRKYNAEKMAEIIKEAKTLYPENNIN